MKDKENQIGILLNFYDWHTKLFINALDGINNEDAHNRLNTKANHIAWIAGSLVYQRAILASFFDIKIEVSQPELFKDNKGIQENVTYPFLDEYRRDWNRISPQLRKAMEDVSEEKLKSPDPWKMPGGPYNFRDTLTACADRESYCIGQIGLWRRLLGYEAMKYE